MSMPVVDICMLTWNTRDVSAAAVRALRASDQGVSYRLLVRDNGSRDGTAQAVSAADPQAEVEEASDNIGFAAGMNSLIARTSADYVLVLNGDATLAPGALRRLVDVAERFPDVAAVAPLLLRPDGGLEHSTWPLPSLWLTALYATGLRRLVPPVLADRWLLQGGWRHDRARDVGWAIGAALLVPRRALESIGGFDERYFMYGEDVDWCWRARAAGWRIRFEPAAVVRHVGGASGGQRYPGEVDARKASVSARVVADHRGPWAGVAFRALQVAISLRIGLMARLRGDAAAAAWAAANLRGTLRLLPPERVLS